MSEFFSILWILVDTPTAMAALSHLVQLGDLAGACRIRRSSINKCAIRSLSVTLARLLFGSHLYSADDAGKRRVSEIAGNGVSNERS